MVVGECCSRRKSTAFSLKMLVQLDSAIFTSFRTLSGASPPTPTTCPASLSISPNGWIPN